MTGLNNHTRRVATSNKPKNKKTRHIRNQCGSPPISSRTFQLLKHSWKRICKYKSNQCLHTDKEEPLTAEDITNICNTSMYSHIPTKIKQDFESTSQQGVKRIGIELMRGRTANIYIAVPIVEEKEEEEENNLNMVAYMTNIIAWLCFVSEIASPNCAKTLDIYLLLGNAKKELPDIEDAPIDQIHANTAFTTSCSASNAIYVFRREEWFKVFIHETFHCLGLDFSSNIKNESNKCILSLFPAIDPRTDVKLYETYCEMWAEVFHLMFCLFTSAEGRHCVAFSESVFRRALSQEQRFSIYQSNKILIHAGYEYKTLFSSSSLSPYRENTAAFSYYVIKSIILWNMDAFIGWCSKYSSSKHIPPIQFDQNNIVKYCNFIEDLVKRKNKSYECAVRHMRGKRGEEYAKILNTATRNPLSTNTLRMTLIDPNWY